MAAATWRKVGFFVDERGVDGSRALPHELNYGEHDNESQNLTAVQAGTTKLQGGGRGESSDGACAATSGRGHVCLGSCNGGVVVLERGLKVTKSWKAHSSRVLFMHQLNMKNVLITVAEEDIISSNGATIKNIVLHMWDVDRTTQNKVENSGEKESGETSGGTILDGSTAAENKTKTSPICIRTVKLNAGKTNKESLSPANITAFDVLEESPSQLFIVFGFSNCTIIYLKGDVIRERTKQGKISLVGINSDGHDDDSSDVGRYASITGLHIRRKNEGDDGMKVIYATTRFNIFTIFKTRVGTSFKARHLDDIGSNIRCSTLNSKSELLIARPEAVYCYDLDGRGPCFAFDGEKRLAISFKSSYLVIIGRGGTGSSGMSTTDDLIIYDLRNKVIAYRRAVGEVDHVLFEWGLVVVITPTKIFSLRERESSERLDLLFKKGLYNIAISIAAVEGGDVAEVQRRYGDHLYQKKDYEGAMSHYCMTIGSLEPSYVIRKYLDSQRIKSLTSYLELLHERGIASADHTTLLLNCYTKLKDVKKLDAFLLRENPKDKLETSISRFDVETAIRVLRSAEYFDHALGVAERSGEHELYVAILLEDLFRYSEALQYIKSLPPLRAAAELRRYGKVLVTALPDETTSLLMYICTLESVGDSNYDGVESHDLIRNGRPRAVEFIHCFVERQETLIVFLEFIINSIQLDQDSAIVYETLLDLYLSHNYFGIDGMIKSQQQSQETRLEKALNLLKQGWQSRDNQLYNVDQALLLCEMRDFKDGLLFLYENLGMHTKVFNIFKRSGNYSSLLEAAMRIDYSAGGQSTQIWIDILEYFSSSDATCEEYLKKAISHIESENILPPLVVLQILSKSDHVTVSVVKDYIARVLESHTSMIDDDCNAIRRYRDEIERMRAEVHEMSSQARIFQLNKCSICSTPLDLPAIHFYCMHSFHQRCLGDNEHECPICAGKQRQVETIRANLAASLLSHDKFYQQLENSSDGFDVVADYFSRGVFSNSSTDSASR